MKGQWFAGVALAAALSGAGARVAGAQQVPDARDAQGLDLTSGVYPVSTEEQVALFNGVPTYHRELFRWPEPGGQEVVFSLDYSGAVEHQRFDITPGSGRTHATGVFGEWSLCLNGHALWTGNLAPYLHNGELPGEPNLNESGQAVDGAWRTQGFGVCDRAYSGNGDNGDVTLALSGGGLAEFGYPLNSPIGGNPAMRPTDPGGNWRAWLDTPAHTGRTLKVKKPDGTTWLFDELPLTLYWPGYYFNDSQGPRAFRLSGIAGPTSEYALTVSYQYADSGFNRNAYLHPTYMGIGDGHGRTAEVTVDENLAAGTCDIDIHTPFPAPDTHLSFVESRYTDHSGNYRHSYLFYLESMLDRVGRLTRFRHEPDDRADAFPSSCSDSLAIRAMRWTGVDYPAGGSSTYGYVALPATRPPCPSPTDRYEDPGWQVTGRSACVAPMVRLVEVREAAAGIPVTTAALAYSWNQSPPVGADFESPSYRYVTTLNLNGGAPMAPARGARPLSRAASDGASVTYAFSQLPFVPATSGSPVARHWESKLVESSVELASGELHRATFTYDARITSGSDYVGTFQPATRTLSVEQGGSVRLQSTSSVEYDSLARVTASTDALGVRRAVEYFDPPALNSPWSGSGMYLVELVSRQSAMAPDGSLLSDSWYDREPALGRVTASHTRLDDARVANRTFAYDPVYPLRLTHAVGPMGETEDFSYDGEFIPNTVWWAESPGKDRPVRTTIQGGGMAAQVLYRAYDVEGHVLREADGAGHTTHTAVDGEGRLTSVALPGDVMTGPPPPPQFRPQGLPYSQTPWPSTVISFVETPGASAMLESFYPAMLESLSTTVQLDGLGRMRSQRVRIGASTVERDFSYDACGRIAQAGGALVGTAAFTYDELGRELSATAPSGGVVQFEHSASASLTEHGLSLPFPAPDGGFSVDITRQPSGAASLRATDVGGRLVAAAEYAPGAAGPSAVRYYQSDLLGRVAAIYAPDGGVTRFTCDLTGSRVRVVEPDGSTRSALVDLSGRPTCFQDETQAASQSWSYVTYDALSRPVESGTVSGLPAAQLQGDVDARIVPAGVHWRARYTHDGSGAADATGCLTHAESRSPSGAVDQWDLQYDSRKRVIGRTVTFAGLPRPAAMSFQYDRLDRRTSITFPDGQTLQFLYEPSGGPLSQVRLAAPSKALVTLQRDAAGRLSSCTAGPMVTQWAYGSGGAVLSQGVSSMGRTLLSEIFEYDADGRLSARTAMPGGRWDFSRDSLSRLVSVTFSQEAGAPQLRYHFNQGGDVDSVGSPLTWQRGTFAARRLTRINQPPYGSEGLLYDPHGNVITRLRAVGSDTLTRLDQRFGPDGELQCIRGTTPWGEDSAVYGYDPWLGRSRRQVAGVTTYQLRDENGDLQAELDSTGAMVRGYVRGEGRLLGVLEPGGRFVAYACDVAGSVRLGVQEDGAVRFSQDFLPFGELERFEGEERPAVGFLGAEEDWESGYCYLKSRYYDPENARFLGPDPLRDAGADPYGYAWGDPLTFSDPSGLAPEWDGSEIPILPFNLPFWTRTLTLPTILIIAPRIRDRFLSMVAALRSIYSRRDEEMRVAGPPPETGRPVSGGARVGDRSDPAGPRDDFTRIAHDAIAGRLKMYRTLTSPVTAHVIGRFMIAHEAVASLRVALALSREKDLSPAQLQTIHLKAGSILLAETTVDVGTLALIELNPGVRMTALAGAPVWAALREDLSAVTDDALSRVVPGYSEISVLDSMLGPEPAGEGP